GRPSSSHAPRGRSREREWARRSAGGSHRGSAVAPAVLGHGQTLPNSTSSLPTSDGPPPAAWGLRRVEPGGGAVPLIRALSVTPPGPDTTYTGPTGRRRAAGCLPLAGRARAPGCRFFPLPGRYSLW